MPKSKKNTTEPKDTADAKPEAEAKDTRPRRSLKPGGPEYPVNRSFYNPKTNMVMDVVEVKKKILNADKTTSEVTFERAARCQDERIQKAHCRPEEITEVPVMLEVDSDLEGLDDE